MPALPSRHCAPGTERLRIFRSQQREESRREAPQRKILKGRAWQKVRAAFLSEHPLCEDCEAMGRMRAATEVHHKVKLVLAPERAFDVTNLQALCSHCHNVRTGRGE